MSDKEKLIELLKSFNLVENNDNPASRWGLGDREYSVIENKVIIGAGIGYNGFFCEFYFDKNGKYENHGCWE